MTQQQSPKAKSEVSSWNPRRIILVHTLPFIVAIVAILWLIHFSSRYELRHAKEEEIVRQRIRLVTTLWMDLYNALPLPKNYYILGDTSQFSKFRDIEWNIESDLIALREQNVVPDSIYKNIDSLWQEAYTLALSIFQSNIPVTPEVTRDLEEFKSTVSTITEILSGQYKVLQKTLAGSEFRINLLRERVNILIPALLGIIFLLMLGMAASIVVNTRRQTRIWQEEILKQLRQEEYINQLQATIGNILELPELIPRLLPPIVKYVGADAGTVAIYDHDREIITYPFNYNLPKEINKVKVEAGKGVAWYTIQKGESVVLMDYREHPLSLKPWVDAGVRSMIAVPLKVGDEVVGAMGLFRLKEVKPFDEYQINLAKSVAPFAAMAIHRAKVFERESNLAKQLKIVSGIAGKVTKILDINKLLAETTELLIEEFNFFRVSIILYDSDKDELIIKAMAGHHKDKVPVGTRLKMSETGLIQWVVRNGKTLRVNDVNKDSRYVRFFPEVKSELVVPIKEADKVIGVINITSDKEFTFTEIHTQAMEALASELAVAIRNANLFDELNQRVKELYMLYMVNKEGATTLDFDKLANEVADLLMGHFEADAFFIALYDEYKNELDYRILIEEDKRLPRMTLPLGKGLTSYVISTREPLLIRDWNKEKHNLPEPVIVGEGEEVMSWLGIPLLVGDKVLGVMSIQAFRTNAFHQEDVNLLMGIASSLAISIRNTELYSKSQYQARMLQALHNVLTEISNLANIQEMIDYILNEILDALNLKMGVIFLKENYSIRGIKEEVRSKIIKAAKNAGLKPNIVIVIEDCQVINRESPLKNIADILLGYGIKAVLSAPIIIDQDRIGRIVVLSDKPKIWTEEERHLIESIGKEVGEAIERLNLLEGLKTQASQLSSIMKSVDEGIAMLRKDLVLVVTNPAAESILQDIANISENKKLISIAGKPIEEFTKPPPPGQLCHTVEIRKPILRTFELVMRPLIAQEGWVLIIRETTEEETLKRQVELQERLATVGQLAAGIAHDFNNILTVIIGTAELLKGNKQITPAMEQSLETIITQSHQAASLIRQILDFSRKTVSRKEPLLFEPFLKESIKMLRRTIPENINVTIDIQPGRHLIEADPAQIQQIITNLAVNARDAMPKGGELRLTLKDITVDEENPPPITGMPHGGYAELCIIDTGIGIPPENLPKIFEPFFTTKPRGVGTGLGLSQVYSIVTQHNGFIDVESEVGKGTTFKIYFPLIPKKKKEYGKTQPKLVKGNKEKVLLVEDNSTVRETLKSMLNQLNYTPIVAESGEKGLELYKKHKEEIICVVSDIVMEGMGGEELFDEIKKINPYVKVVFVSGYPLHEKGKELISRGAVGWLQKPVEIEKLAQLLAKTIQTATKGRV